ncbi:MAG: formate/nitrite transporter family protein [Acholeplasma sp.]|nr:formate/nitrite transporter family protein [Acholeplasma sp.]
MKTIFIKAIYAGLLIGIAAIAYLSVDNSVLGATLFSFGLLMIVTSGYYLYTGKVGYLVKEKNYFKTILVTILGNMVGTFFIAIIARLAAPHLISEAQVLVNYKLSHTLWMVLFLSVLCGMMMYLGVDGYRRIRNEFAKVIVVIFAVVIFILAKFEHSIANMVYVFMSFSFSFKAFGYLLVMIVGNGLGATLLCYMDKVTETK